MLLKLRNSPLAKSPPKSLPMIPGVTTKDTHVNTSTVIQEEPEKTGEKYI